MNKFLIPFLLGATLVASCGGKGKANEAGEPGNMGMEFLSDTAAGSKPEETVEKAKNATVGAWEGTYFPLYELFDGRKAKDTSLGIRFKMAPDGRGIYREAQLFGDRRKDIFSFQDEEGKVAVSVNHKGWTYYLIDDSTLKDNTGNIFKK